MSQLCEAPSCANPPGGTQCLACNATSCLEHSPAPGKFCNECELLFFSKRDSSASYKTWRICGFLFPWIAFALLAYPLLKNVGFMASGSSMRGFSTGIPLLDMGIVAGILSAIMCGGLGAMAAGKIRRDMVRSKNRNLSQSPV